MKTHFLPLAAQRGLVLPRQRSSFVPLVSLVVAVILGGCSLTGKQSIQKPVQSSELTTSAWVALGKPSPSHRLLHMFVGSWNAKTTMFSADPSGSGIITSTYRGRAKTSWILGDRFLREEFEGDMAGVKFQGIGMMGYDNGARRFTNVWVDSLSTAMMYAHGKYFAEENKFEFTGLVYDPTVSRERTVRTVLSVISPKEYVVTTFEPDSSGEEAKTLEIRYEKVE